MNSTLVKNQKRTYGPREFTESGHTYRITAVVRYDDECGNGHNSFSITGSIDRQSGSRWVEDCGGCIHEEIAAHFPELAPLIKWHLFDATGPMHYIANVTYHASDLDYNGLANGERRQLRNGRTNLPVWERVIRNSQGEQVSVGSSSWTDSEEKPTEQLSAAWEPVWKIGKGKERDLKAARSIAVWPDATDEELTAPGLEQRLRDRLPSLVEAFRRDVESLGFTF